MIVVLFRSKLTLAAGQDYAAANAEMEQYVKTAPGFLAVKSFNAEDGERLTVVWWRDRDSLEQWRHNARHVDVKAEGRKKWYEYYKIEVAEVYRQSEFERPRVEATSVGNGGLPMNLNGVEWANEQGVAAEELYPGVTRKTLWQQKDGAKAWILEIAPGGKFLEPAVHAPGPEQVYVLSGVFNDGVRDYPVGSFIHNPAGSSHVPQSKFGCKLLVFFPEG